MEKTGVPADTTFTAIYESEHDGYGNIIVCIRGSHNVNDPNFMPLAYEFEVLRRNESDDDWVLLEDLVVGQELVCLATTYWQMMRGTIVTSEAQPQREGAGEKTIWRLDIPEYGVTVINSCGMVRHDDGLYHIFVANPGPDVYLTVILEVISDNPLEWIGIRIDKDLVDSIITIYLVSVDAIEGASDDEPEDGDTLGDDTFPPGQYWMAAAGIDDT